MWEKEPRNTQLFMDSDVGVIGQLYSFVRMVFTFRLHPLRHTPEASHTWTLPCIFSSTWTSMVHGRGLKVRLVWQWLTPPPNNPVTVRLSCICHAYVHTPPHRHTWPCTYRTPARVSWHSQRGWLCLYVENSLPLQVGGCGWVEGWWVRGGLSRHNKSKSGR